MQAPAADLRAEIRARRLDAKARARYWAKRAQTAARVDKLTKVAVGISAAGALGSWAVAFAPLPFFWQGLCAGAAGGALASPVTSDASKTARFGQLSGQWLWREAEWDALWRRARAGEAVDARDVHAAADKDDVVLRASGEKANAAKLARVRDEIERGDAGDA